MEKLKRNELIIKMYSDPNNIPTLQEVADKFGLTRERIRQILNKHNISDRQLKPIDYDSRIESTIKFIDEKLLSGEVPTRKEIDDVLGWNSNDLISQIEYNGYIPHVLDKKKEKNFSDNDILDILREFKLNHGKVTSYLYSNLKDKNHPSVMTINTRFGSWTKAVDYALNNKKPKREVVDIDIQPLVKYVNHCVDNNTCPTFISCLEFSNEAKTLAAKFRKSEMWSGLIKKAIIKVYQERKGANK
jgi:hypothetical protein